MESEFRSRLQRVLHKDPEQPAADLALSVQIREQASAGYELVVRARQHGEALERVLEPKTCADALEAAAVVVALAVDPNARAADSLSPERPRDSSRKAGLTVRSALLGGVALRELPQAAPFLSADTGLDFRAFSASLEAFWIAPERARLASDGVGRGGEIGAFGGGLAACYVPVQDAGRLSTCLTAQVGAWTSKGSAVLHPEAKLEPWLSTGARVRYLIPLGYRLGVLLQADATWLGSRPDFFLDGLGTVFVPPAFGARFGSGLQLRF
ncbi:MAG TPA: hypothetical protein VGF76_08375 [Polyangiaceae bacterium]